MKRKTGAMLLAACILSTSVVTTRAETLHIDGRVIAYNLPAISLYVNNVKIETKVMDPIQLDGRVLVPAREVFEAMGARVKWDNGAKQVTIEYKNKTIILVINKTVATIDGKAVNMDVPGKIINNKVMIPVRFVSESLGFIVHWNASSRSVSIKEPVTSTPDVEGGKNITGQTYSGQSNKNHLSVPPGNHETTSIQKVEVSESKNIMNATITASSAISGTSISTMSGKLIVDIKNSKNQLNSQITPGANTYVKSIRTSQFTSDTTRVVFDLKSGTQVSASLSNDRKQLRLQFKAQNLEQMNISSTNTTDKIYFKGLGETQILVTEGKNQALQFTLPNVRIEQAVNWTGISSLFIDKITMNQVGNDIQGTIQLKKNITYAFENVANGTYLIIKAAQISGSEEPSTPPSIPSTPNPSNPPPSEGDKDEKPEQKPENTASGLTYTAGSKPKLTLNNLSGLTTSKIKVTDDYRNRKLVIDLGANYSSILKTEKRTINDGMVKTISISNPGTTQITIETQKVYSYHLSQNNGAVTFQMVKPSEKYSQIVVLDLGHGGSDSGTVGNGLKEKDVNFNQGMALYKLLEADSNIKVYMTREIDVYPTLQFRSTLANEIEADLFVSIHNNSASSSSVKGAETLYYPSTTDTRGKAIAQLVQNSLVKDSGMVNRGIKARSDLYVLNTTNMPAILIETGFLSNADDAKRINTTSFVNTWAKGVYQAIIEGFKLL